MHPNTTKTAVDTIVERCKGFRMDLDDYDLVMLVEWKLWQLHRAATRKFDISGVSRGQSRGPSDRGHAIIPHGNYIGKSNRFPMYMGN